jgi:subtilase family serine protease
VPDGVAHPTYEILRPAQGLSQPPGGYTPHAGPGGAAPAYSPGQSPAGYWPAQLRHAYGFDKLSLDGSGQTIAVVDAYDDPNLASDLAAFDAQFNLPAPPSFRQVDENGNSSSDVPTDFTGNWEVEEALDVEWAHAIAPKANIVLVEAFSPTFNDLLTAVDTARNLPGVVAVSMSWGGNEGPSETGFDSFFTTPSGHPGVTFVASSGDSGAPGGYPAMSPNVLAVGGTTLVLDGPDNRVSEVGWSGSGGGPSSVESQPAYQSSYAQSSYVRNTLGNTVLLGGPRGNPDVSYVADPNPGVAMYDTFPNQFGVFGWAAVGGTSDAAPQWAALVALVDQGRGAGNSLDGATRLLPALSLNLL